MKDIGWSDILSVGCNEIDEERLMLKHGYPETAEHKTAHRELIDSAKQLQQEILQANKPMVDDQIQFLERWLTEHILTADMRLGAYLTQST